MQAERLPVAAERRALHVRFDEAEPVRGVLRDRHAGREVAGRLLARRDGRRGEVVFGLLAGQQELEVPAAVAAFVVDAVLRAIVLLALRGVVHRVTSFSGARGAYAPVGPGAG